MISIFIFGLPHLLVEVSDDMVPGVEQMARHRCRVSFPTEMLLLLFQEILVQQNLLVQRLKQNKTKYILVIMKLKQLNLIRFDICVDENIVILLD